MASSVASLFSSFISSAHADTEEKADTEGKADTEEKIGTEEKQAPKEAPTQEEEETPEPEDVKAITFLGYHSLLTFFQRLSPLFKKNVNTQSAPR